MTPSKYDAAMAAADNRIFVFGGWNQGSLSSVEEYNPETDKWTDKSNLPFVIQNSQAISVEGRIFICGGIIYPEDGNEKKDFMIEYLIKKDKIHK
jgi:N-acetylneuraminic acid mutarotase